MAFKIFGFYLLFCLFIQLYTSYLRRYKIDNLFLSHYYFIGQFVFLSFFYLEIFKKKFNKIIVKYVLAFVTIAITIYYIIYPEKYTQFNILEIVLTSVPLIVYSFLFFIQKIENIDKKYIYLNSGFFLYILCSTLLFVSGNIKADIKRFIWYSNVTLYLIYQILIFVEWYKHFRKKEVSS